MRIAVLPFLFGLAAGASCPYAEQARRSVSSCPYANPAAVQRDEPRTLLARSAPAEGKKGVFFMNRIAPSVSELYVANADGSDERLLLGNDTGFEYHAQWSPDAQWIIFTSERNGDGNSDLWRVHPDGTGLEQIIATPAVETGGAISPNGTLVAFQSTNGNYKSNIWVLDLTTGESRNLTNTDAIAGNSSLPDGHFRPSWSPDGEWLVFSSDKNTLWRGHNNNTGWEHTQELSIYAIRPNGSDFRQVATKEGYALGSPKFSPDGSRVLYYELTTENTWGARRPEGVDAVDSQIVSVDFATGGDRIEHTSDGGLKVSPQYVTADTIGFLHKTSGALPQGLNYTAVTPGSATNYTALAALVRSPAWSPDGSQVVYEKTAWTPVRAQDKVIYSWDDEWEYRFSDVFPTLSKQGILALTQKQLGNSSIVTMNPSGSDSQVVFDVSSTGQINNDSLAVGLSGAFQPAWSSDGEWIAFGLGNWFGSRASGTAYLYRVTSNGSYYEELTNGTYNAGFPSFSPDGRYLVYREWDGENGPLGLRIMDLTDKSVQVLTTGWDNLPGWSPDGERIVFTRRTSVPNDSPYEDDYNVCTIRPDGTDYTVLTTSQANDGHAVWSADGRILYSTGEFGFQDEASLYDDTFQMYGQIMAMNADGSNKTVLTNGLWEDSMPLYVPNSVFQ
ncbi:tricorn protease N-terminal domain-containing protein [Peniophora sp. CONT]|nr:tricorn protease N-terminal domain-containing protein [Peniophora sp. CONT]